MKCNSDCCRTRSPQYGKKRKSLFNGDFSFSQISHIFCINMSQNTLTINTDITTSQKTQNLHSAESGQFLDPSAASDASHQCTTESHAPNTTTTILQVGTTHDNKDSSSIE